MIRNYRGKKADGDWIVGSLMDEGDNPAIKQGENPLQEVELESVGQWTGLWDCKGVRIFEGDILDKPNPTIHKYLVKYAADSGAYVLYYNKPDKKGFLFHIQLDQRCIEGFKLSIIGNETDNPDLWLKEEEE